MDPALMAAITGFNKKHLDQGDGVDTGADFRSGAQPVEIKTNNKLLSKQKKKKKKKKTKSTKQKSDTPTPVNEDEFSDGDLFSRDFKPSSSLAWDDDDHTSPPRDSLSLAPKQREDDAALPSSVAVDKSKSREKKKKKQKDKNKNKSGDKDNGDDTAQQAPVEQEMEECNKSAPSSSTAADGDSSNVLPRRPSNQAHGLLTGWGSKRGYHNTAYKERFFVLTKSALEYFKSGEYRGACPQGRIPLPRVVLVSQDTSQIEDRRAVRDNAPEGEEEKLCCLAVATGARLFVLRFASPDICTQWSKAIQQALPKLKRGKNKHLSEASFDGFLLKKGVRYVSTPWRRRYCVLQGAFIYYFPGRKSYEQWQENTSTKHMSVSVVHRGLLGCIPLAGCRVQNEGSTDMGYEVEIATEGRVYHLVLNSQTELELFVGCVKDTVQRLKFSGHVELEDTDI